MTTHTATATAAATAWTIDPAHSQVQFAVRHLMISTVRGRFGEVSGTLVGGQGDPGQASIELSIPVSTIDTRETQRDAHLRSADFFDADHHPFIRFESTRIAREGGGAFTVEGNLTIRGVTRSITLKVIAEGQGRDPWGGERVAYSTAATINRKDFGLHWNQALETGGVVVGDEVKISAELEFVKAAS